MPVISWRVVYGTEGDTHRHVPILVTLVRKIPPETPIRRAEKGDWLGGSQREGYLKQGPYSLQLWQLLVLPAWETEEKAEARKGNTTGRLIPKKKKMTIIVEETVGTPGRPARPPNRLKRKEKLPVKVYSNRNKAPSLTVPFFVPGCQQKLLRSCRFILLM